MAMQKTEALQGTHERRTQVCVIRSGPGGAVVAKELAMRGVDVIVLEAGPRLKASESTRDIGEFMQRFLSESGSQRSGGQCFCDDVASRVCPAELRRSTRRSLSVFPNGS